MEMKSPFGQCRLHALGGPLAIVQVHQTAKRGAWGLANNPVRALALHYVPSLLPVGGPRKVPGLAGCLARAEVHGLLPEDVEVLEFVVRELDNVASTVGLDNSRAIFVSNQGCNVTIGLDGFNTQALKLVT